MIMHAIHKLGRKIRNNGVISIVEKAKIFDPKGEINKEMDDVDAQV
jgi:hypothetical protein